MTAILYDLRMNRLTAKEAADALGITKGRVIQLIAAGTLKAEKFGNQFFIKSSDLEKVKHRKPGRPPKHP